MKRSNAREIALQLSFYATSAKKPVSEIFEEFFEKDYYDTLAEDCEVYAESPDKWSKEYIIRLATLIEDYRIQLDAYIEKYSRGWKLGRISKTAAAIMRCAMCEILYMDDIPNATAINEAIELAKGYDDEETVRFINGILGGFMRGELADKTEEQISETEE